MHCPHCGQEHPDHLKYCPITGKELDSPIFCEKCGSRIMASWKICPYCGATLITAYSPPDIQKIFTEQESPQVKKARINWKIIVSGLSAIIFIIIVIFVVSLIGENKPHPGKVTSTQTAVILLTATKTYGPIATASPSIIQQNLLEGVGFPIETVAYPDEWPSELYYPDEFRLVEFNMGSLDPNSSISLSAKLRYKGNVKDAVELLSSFFIKQGWHILEQTDFNTNSTYLLIGKNSEADQGILLISKDASDPTITIILSTLSQSK